MTGLRARYLLWDHDGVLVDTERWYFESTAEAVGRLGIRLDRARHLELQSRGIPSWELAREAGIDEAVIAAHRAERDARYREYLRRENIEIEGVERVLEELGQRHEMAVVTTSKRVDFELIHRTRSIVPHMAFVLTLEDYPKAKPAPDPYLAALARFGARPDEAIVIEDSERGLRSALAAGIRCIVVENEFTRGRDFSGAERVLESLQQLPPLLET
jgi:HAD superfamily hydrolase (TIGR01509 family)